MIYKNITDNLLTWITNNCINYSNFGGIHAAFKSGYINDEIIRPGGREDIGRSCRRTISGNIVSQVNYATIYNDFTVFVINQFTNKGYNINDTVEVNGMIALFNLFVSFCQTRICYSVSFIVPNTTYLIYCNVGGTVSSNYNYKSNIIYHNNVQEMIYTITQLVRQITRIRPVVYTFTSINNGSRG